MKSILLSLTGFSGGIVVGGAIGAFITLLQLIPRLIQFTETDGYIKLYEWTFIIGSIIFTILYFFDITFKLNKYFSILFGLLNGAFVGLFTSALAEVLNVIPVMSKKFRLNNYIFYLVVALIAGKVFGSMFFWLSYVGR